MEEGPLGARVHRVMQANLTERRTARRFRQLGWLAVAIAIPLIGWRLYQLPTQASAETAALSVTH
ncbi:MAG: hypothetical protein AB8I08_34390 [Sandaracinaceae bacterium]